MIDAFSNLPQEFIKAKYDILISTLENTLLSNNIMDYYYVAQGKTTIPNVDDGEEFIITDVSGCIITHTETFCLWRCFS